MIKNYYPRVKSVFGVCALALSSSLMFGSKTAVAQPVISSVTPASAIPGATVTITGSGFSTTAANNVVYFGGVKVSPAAATATSFNVTLPAGALFAPVTVVNTGGTTYKTGITNKQFLPEFFNTCFVSGAFNFKPSVNFPLLSGAGAYLAVLGDMDGDGKLDLVVANNNQAAANSIYIYRNTNAAGSISAGSFAAPVFVTTSGNPSNIKLADLDADGRLDIIVGYIGGGGMLGIMRNISSGVGNIAFTNRNYIPGGKVSEIAIADYDGDGRPDIAATVTGNTTGADSVKIFKNAITAPPIPTATANFVGASFGTPQGYALPAYADPVSICAGDFDGDGKMDLAVANRALSGVINGSVSIFRNQSTGATDFTFGTHFEMSLATGMYGQQVITADLDADGKSDIIVTGTDYSTAGYLSVFRNQATSGSLSSGSFVSRADITPVGVSPVGLAAGDLDGDGKVDIAMTELISSTVNLYRNTSVSGTITLTSLASYATGVSPIGVSIGDVDGDTKPDVVVANRGTSPAFTNSSLSIFRNYPLPVVGPITGPALVCVPNTDTFRNSVAGGTWSVTNTALATINAANGAVFPVAAGTDTAVYTVICNNDTSIVMQAFTVNVFPTVANISGTGTALCSGYTLSLTDATSGGTWSSSNTAAATVSGGAVYGVAAGTATISYAVTNSCGTTTKTYGPITVSTSPQPITGTLSVCVGSNVTLSSTTTGGTWVSTTTANATITNGGVVHGVAAGTSVISYTISGGCYDTAIVTVTAGPVIAAISGATSVCEGSNITLSDATTGGTWRSSSLTNATVLSPGVIHGVAAGASTIYYKVTNSCGTDSVSYPITVNAMPGAITGIFSVCAGNTVSLFNTISGGTWASNSTGTATVTTSGGVGGVVGGTVMISYTLAGGCYDTAIMTVNDIPSMPTGGSSVCIGSTITLSDVTSGGTWSQTGGLVSVGATSGAVTGVTAGTTAITYTKTSTGCFNVLTPFTVNTPPAAITGPTTACVGVPTTLSSTPTGGTWTMTPSTLGSIDPVTGVVTGSASGAATVTYTIGSTGCFVTRAMTVSPSPGVISGATSVCLGQFLTLTDTPPGGVWSSSNPIAAPVNAIGIVSGATLGTTTVTYTIGGCSATHSVTVTSPPGAITGSVPMCPHNSVLLSDTSAGGTWSSASSAIAIVNPATGLVTGVSGGTVNITYSLSGAGCYVTVPVLVHAGPAPITGATTVCVGLTANVFNDSTGGIWSSSDTTIVKAGAATGLLTGMTPGTITITYTTPAYGCSETWGVTSYPIVAPNVVISVSPNDTVCAGTPVTYTAVVTNGGPTPVYQWTVNHVPVSSSASFTYIPLNNDTIKCVVVSNAVCVTPTNDTDLVRMEVITRRTPIMNLTTGMGDTVCLGMPITLNPNTLWGGTAPTYSWKINGVNVGPGATFTYVPANGDIATVIVHGNYVCPNVDTATDTLRLTVSPYLTPSVSLIGSDTACGGYPVVYYAAPVNGGTAPTYQWIKNGVNFSTGPMLAYMANTGDVISVVMTTNFPCVTTNTVTSTPHTVTVVPVLIPNVTVSVSPGYILAPGMTATFTGVATNMGSNPSYKWKKNGIIIPGATSLVYSTNILATGDSFTIIATNNDFCNGVSVFASQEVAIGANVGVGQVNAPNSDIHIAPNPTKGTFTINGNLGITTNEELQVEITNMLGQVVYVSKFNANTGSIEQVIALSDNLSNGMYILNIHSEHLAKTIHFELAR